VEHKKVSRSTIPILLRIPSKEVMSIANLDRVRWRNWNLWNAV